MTRLRLLGSASVSGSMLGFAQDSASVHVIHLLHQTLHIVSEDERVRVWLIVGYPTPIHAPHRLNRRRWTEGHGQGLGQGRFGDVSMWRCGQGLGQSRCGGDQIPIQHPYANSDSNARIKVYYILGYDVNSAIRYTRSSVTMSTARYGILDRRLRCKQRDKVY